MGVTWGGGLIKSLLNFRNNGIKWVVFLMLLLHQGSAELNIYFKEACLCLWWLRNIFKVSSNFSYAYFSLENLLTRPPKLEMSSVCMYVPVMSWMCNCIHAHVQLYMGLCVWCLGVLDIGKDCCLVTIPYFCKWNYIKEYPRNVLLFLNFHSGNF